MLKTLKDSHPIARNENICMTFLKKINELREEDLQNDFN